MLAAVISISAVVDEVAELPCNLSAAAENDRVQIVLWYRGESDVPIYR